MAAVLDGVRRILFYGDSLSDGSSYPDHVVNKLEKLYPEGGFELFNAAGAGDTPPDPASAKGWKPYDAEALAARQPWWNSRFPQRGGWMPFDDANPKGYAYGRTSFEAPAAGDYELQIGGSPTPQIVWGNGVNVWEGRRNNGFHPNADRMTVRLNAGRNEIMVASSFMMFLGVHTK